MGTDRSGGEIELVSSDVQREPGEASLVPQVVDGLRGLAGGLYDGVSAGPGNVVLSPYSVLVALGMTLAGARGTTAEEMRDVLGVGDLGERWHSGVNALTAYVDGLAGPQQRADRSEADLALATANQIFGQRGVGWEQGFVDLLAKQYAAPVRAVDFAGATEQARGLINDWVERQTNERIVDLVPAGALDALTRLVLVNAVYLKAPWEHPFEKSGTSKGAFRLADGSKVQAEMMHRSQLHASVAKGDGWQAVVIPYAGRQVAMTVVLPDESRFDEVERAVSGGGFTHVVEQAKPTMVALTLPKWTFRSQAPLAELLASLGMPTAFVDGKADFTPMTEEDLSLHVSAVLHQAFIAVDEEGTEAAAATAVVMATRSMPITEPFVVDRPFLFAIHDTEHNAPLFVGRVSDPTA